MKPIRILVVDDSAFSRRAITMMLEGMDGVEVAGYAGNGEEGIQKTIALKPDLVTLDLEMPKMDGFSLLRILHARFSLPVIVVSALSGADKVFKALELGALDFVAKPSSLATPELMGIKEDLQRKIRQALHARIIRVISQSRTKNEVNSVFPQSGARGVEFSAANHLPAPDPVSLVAIGSSTGGPPALQSIFSSFNKDCPFCIMVSQHMPSGFTKAFAERLDRNSGFDVKEAADGDVLKNGLALIAPGGKNLIVEKKYDRIVAKIIEPSSEDRYIPSVDVMLESCAPVFRDRATAVILTGMGNDGSKGVRKIKEYGGYVIAESEETSVVYGMPREAFETGAVDRVAPIHEIHREIVSKFQAVPLPHTGKFV